MRAAIVGGGILGLATARTILRDRPGAEVVVLERARLCRRGQGLMRDFCAEQGIAYEACGKLVVATDAEERPRLEALAERAAEKEVEGSKG